MCSGIWYRLSPPLSNSFWTAQPRYFWVCGHCFLSPVIGVWVWVPTLSQYSVEGCHFIFPIRTSQASYLVRNTSVLHTSPPFRLLSDPSARFAGTISLCSPHQSPSIEPRLQHPHRSRPFSFAVIIIFHFQGRGPCNLGYYCEYTSIRHPAVLHSDREYPTSEFALPIIIMAFVVMQSPHRHFITELSPLSRWNSKFQIPIISFLIPDYHPWIRSRFHSSLEFHIILIVSRDYNN